MPSTPISIDRPADARPARGGAEARLARDELAACHRLIDALGWADGLCARLTVRVPTRADGATRCFAAPLDLHDAEVRGDDLLAVDADGRDTAGGGRPVDRAGVALHAALHAARDDAHCVLRVRTTAGCAVACEASGLRHDNFYSALFHGTVVHHDLGPPDADAPRRLVAAMGSASAAILRHDGLLALGRTLPQAFKRLWTLQRACEVQIASDAGAGANVPIDADVLGRVRATQAGMQRAGGTDNDEMLFDALLRRARIDLRRDAA